MLEFATKLYSAGPWNCLEDARCRGPLTLATVGDGSYQALFGAVWRITWDRKRGLILQQWQESDFVEVDPDEPLPDLPKQARHISLAFDQAARPVLAYQLAEQIHIRQWSPGAGEYQFSVVPGVDPCLLMDAHVHFFSPDSDVLLYHLDADRTGLWVALQRESYLSPVLKTVLPETLYLDQVAATPYLARVAMHNIRGEKVRLQSPLFPVQAEDLMAVSGGPSTGDWDTISHTFTAEDLMAISGGPSTGLWDTENFAFTAEDLMVITGGPATGLWESTLILLSAADQMAVSGGPATGSFADVGIPYGPAGDAMSITGGPVTGTWT